MTLDRKPQLLYLNRENRWLDFKWRGLELKDGSLRLASLPLFETTLTEELANLAAPDGPAGLAVGGDGTIYFTDPANHRVLRINPCDGDTSFAPCLGGEGSFPTSFSTPRGLLFDPVRRALFVADSGNHRLQVFNTETFQLLDIWDDGIFDTPWSLAIDRKGNIYVADAGKQSVQKFDSLGRLVENFWTTASGVLAGASPTEVAIAQSNDKDEVVVLAPASAKIFILDTNGELLRTIESGELSQAMGLAARDGAIYVGDNAQKRILKFRLDGTFVGEVRGYNGPVAALAFDHAGQLLVHAGSADIGILHISVEGAYGKNGFMWGGPFGTGNPLPKSWFSLKGIPGELPIDAHLRFFTHATNNTDAPAVQEDSDEPFAVPAWKAMPLDVTDGLISGEPKSYVWVAVEFSGEGLTTPTLNQLTLEYDHEGYLRYFPAIYREDPIKRAFLENFLALYESFFDDTEQAIRRLSALFDVKGAPEEFLDWLAGWLALDLDEHWSEEKKRSAIAKAFELYGRRGTAAGLREALRFFAGIEAHIAEPILYSSWWALPGDSESEHMEGAMLGFNTTLAPEDPQGAVVGTTATYDESSLISIDEFGAPLFSSVAHRFVVRLHKAQTGGPKRQKELEAIIEREKPAHATAHICLIEPGLTIGHQAQLGIDSVVGGQPSLARLDASSFSSNLQLGGDPAGRVGVESRLGQTTRLGDAGPQTSSRRSEKRPAGVDVEPGGWHPHSF